MAGQFQFDGIYSMTFILVSKAVYWQRTTLLTSCISQMGNLAKLYDVGGNSSNVIGENEPVKICDVMFTTQISTY